MGADTERRSYDAAINDIALNVNTIKTRQEDYIKQIEKCEDQTKKNTLAIGTLETKVSMVTYIGSGAFLVTVGTLLRNYFKTHS